MAGVLENRTPLTPLLANPPGGQQFAPQVPLPYGSDPFTGTPSSLGQVNPVGPDPEEVVGQLSGAREAPPLPEGTPGPLRMINEAMLTGAQFGMPATGMFVGPRAVGADLQRLAEAKQMAGYGIHANDIWFKTGWFQGKDGGWRYEIPDWQSSVDLSHGDPDFNRKYQDRAMALQIWRVAKQSNGAPIPYVIKMLRKNGIDVSPQAAHLAQYHSFQHLYNSVQSLDAVDPRSSAKMTIGDVVKHPDLSQAYPDLMARPFKYYTPLSLTVGADAGYSPSGDFMVANKLSPGGGKEHTNIIHELQHAVQRREGWNPGSADPDWDTYFQNAGEVEARNTQARLQMDALQRRMKTPWSTMDVPWEKQLLTGTPSIAGKMTPQQFQQLIDYMRQIRGQ